MFVSVYCDCSNDDHKKDITELLLQYGFKKIMPALFESISVTDRLLIRLKKDIDNSTDYYDEIRIYQYPVEDTLIISSLKNKKWKRLKIQTG